MPKAKPKQNYEQLRIELDTILSELQSQELDVDKALEKYQRGLELAQQLEKYLKTAENKVRQLKTEFDSSS